MKQFFQYRIFGTLLLSLAVFGVSCALESDAECAVCNKVRTVTVGLDEAVPAALETPLCQFRRAAGSTDDYVLERAYASVADGGTLKLPLADLRAYDYRFLMLARGADADWLQVQTAAGGAFEPGDKWDDLRLVSASGAASGEAYSGFTDLTGAQLLEEGTVRLTLTRIAGQVVFDFYRYDEEGARPVSVVSKEVASVLDRVTEVGIVYENPTSALRFGADGVPVPAAVAQESLRQEIRPDVNDFKVGLPQADRGLIVPDTTVHGSVRVEGLFLLPSQKLRVQLTFTYYDTTPVCGNNHKKAHKADCFEQRQLTLTLPASDAEGMPVAADCFTVNRARLRCDRIIDVLAGGGIDAEFDWLK